MLPYVTWAYWWLRSASRSRCGGGDAHPVIPLREASMRWRGPIRQPAPAAGTNKARPPPGASRTAKNRPTGMRGIRQSGEQSRCPGNGTKRARIGKASGYSHRSFRPDAVRYLSVTTAMHRPAVTHPDTRRDKKETARRTAFPQQAGRFRRWWQVLGSNQRRLSRRFYRPLPLAAEPDHRSTAPGVPRTVPALGRKTEADKTTPSWSRIGDQIGSFDAGQLRLDLDRLTGDIALWPSPRKGVAYRPGNLSEVLTEHFRKAHPRGARHPAHLHCRRVKPARPRATRA